jgi:hypothetical protein
LSCFSCLLMAIDKYCWFRIHIVETSCQTLKRLCSKGFNSFGAKKCSVSIQLLYGIATAKKLPLVTSNGRTRFKWVSLCGLRLSCLHLVGSTSLKHLLPMQILIHEY